MKITRKQLRQLINEAINEQDTGDTGDEDTGSRDTGDTGTFGDSAEDWPFDKRWLRYSNNVVYLHPEDAFALESMLFETSPTAARLKLGVILTPQAAKERFEKWSVDSLIRYLTGAAGSQLSRNPVMTPEGKYPLPPKWSVALSVLLGKIKKIRKFIYLGVTLDNTNHFEIARKLAGKGTIKKTAELLNSVYNSFEKNELIKKGFGFNADQSYLITY